MSSKMTALRGSLALQLRKFDVGFTIMKTLKFQCLWCRTTSSGSSNSPIDVETLLSLAGEQSQVENVETSFTPVNPSESLHHSLLIRPPDQPANPKTLRVSVLGMPNAGKSTFINALLGKRIMATSSKIDTTIENTVGVANIGDTQILFQDTPGILSYGKASRHGISGDRVSRPANSFFDADIGIIIADLTSRRIKDGYLQPEILITMLKNRHVPTILVLNKIDKYKKKTHLPVLIHLLTAGRIAGVPFEPEKLSLVPMRLPKVKDFVPEKVDEIDMLDDKDIEKRLLRSEAGLLSKLRHYRGWPHFEDVFVTSAKEREGLDLIKNYILLHAKPGPWFYHSELSSDASPRQIMLDSIRAGLLDNLPREVPYQVLPRVNEWTEMEDGRLIVEVEIICGRQSHFNCVARKHSKIAISTQERLQDIFFMEVYVQVMPVFVKNFHLK